MNDNRATEATARPPTLGPLAGPLTLPVLAAPLFIVSNTALVIAQCLAGIIGSFPALNARPQNELGHWLSEIEEQLALAKAADPDRVIAPYAVNQIVHKTNDRLDADIDACVRHKVPIIITSLRAPDDIVPRIHAYGGIVLHDVTTLRHAERALEAGVDGLILVASGAGGHAGRLSPFALVAEVRRIYDGPLALSGSISTGAGVLAAQAMGADLAYIGTRFVATTEAAASSTYKSMILDATADDIVYSPMFTGIHGNYLKASIIAAGLDPDHLEPGGKDQMSWASTEAKAWRDIWGAGQGVGAIDSVRPTSEVVAELHADYRRARSHLLGLETTEPSLDTTTNDG